MRFSIEPNVRCIVPVGLDGAEGTQVNARLKEGTIAYWPLDEPKLYRLFAQTPWSEEGATEFASRYGLLRHQNENNKDDPPYEPVDLWTHESNKMFTMLRHWDYLQGRISEREAFLHVDAREKFEKWRGTRLREPLIRKWMLEEIHKVLNEKLERDCGFAMDLCENENPPLRLVVRPRTLLGVLWYQASNAIAERADWFLCPTCLKRWVGPTEETGRPKRFCGDSCRVRAYQRRNQQSVSGRMRRTRRQRVRQQKER